MRSGSDEGGSPTVATVLLPIERPRVDAAGSGCFAVVHRDSIPEAVRIVRERPVDAVLVSVHRCGPDQVEVLGHLVREFPGIPTYAEMGYPDLVATVWFSLSGPANLPADIVARVNAEVNRALELPDVRERLKPEGIDPGRMSAREFSAFVADEVKRWGPVVRASGAKND